MAAVGAAPIVIFTEWKELKALDLGRLAKDKATPRVANLCNIYTAK